MYGTSSHLSGDWPFRSPNNYILGLVQVETRLADLRVTQGSRSQSTSGMAKHSFKISDSDSDEFEDHIM